MFSCKHGTETAHISSQAAPVLKKNSKKIRATEFDRTRTASRGLCSGYSRSRQWPRKSCCDAAREEGSIVEFYNTCCNTAPNCKLLTICGCGCPRWRESGTLLMQCLSLKAGEVTAISFFVLEVLKCFKILAARSAVVLPLLCRSHSALLVSWSLSCFQCMQL